MNEPIWVEKEALLLLHGASLARFGGADGIRDEGLLDLAMARPVHRFHYQANDGRCDLADLAAAYAFGFSKSHPFVDGNKRAAFLACGIFLVANGRMLAADPADAIAAVIALAAGTVSDQEFAAWVRENW